MADQTPAVVLAAVSSIAARYELTASLSPYMWVHVFTNERQAPALLADLAAAGYVATSHTPLPRTLRHRRTLCVRTTEAVA